MSDKPVLIELEAAPASPAEAPPVPEAAPEGRAMQAAVRIAARPPSRLGRFFWQAAAALVGFLAGRQVYLQRG